MSATPLSWSHIHPGSPWWIYVVVILALAVHIGGGGIAILSGYGAVSVRKGGARHALFGKFFSCAMLAMGLFGAGLAIAVQQPGNIAGGVLAAYLVATGWMAVKRAPGTVGLFEKCAAVVVFGTAMTLTVWGFQAQAHPAPDDPMAAYFIFAAFAMLFAALDIKMIVRGGVAGRQRILRHLWRMCAAFFFAAGSFFIGQQKVMPHWMQGSPLLFVPALAPLGFMIFWLSRTRLRDSFAPNRPSPE